MTNAREILKVIGRQQLAEELGVGLTTISSASVEGLFPPAWYPTVRRLGAEAGIEVPEHLFKWRKSNDVSPSQEAPQ